VTAGNIELEEMLGNDVLKKEKVKVVRRKEDSSNSEYNLP
jgi:hypothetical protein